MADGGDEYRFSCDFKGAPGGFWVSVSGGDLPGEIGLRINRHADGRYVFTGLVIGEESAAPQEVTSQTLRQIKLSEIRADLFGDAQRAGDLSQMLSIPEAARVVADLHAAQAGVVAGGSSRSPDETTLRDFAQTYEKELALRPQRAMTATARAHGISRATANRWAALCRQRGYLPGGPGRNGKEGQS